MDFPASVRRVRELCSEQGAPLAVVGGLALQAYGVPRLTVDLDVLTTVDCQDRLVRALEADGYTTLHRSSGYSNHAHRDPKKGRIDVVYVDAATAAKLFEAARHFELFPGIEVAVPSPEHLIAMKVLAMKNDPQRRLQDMADIQRILRATRIDPEGVREYFATHRLLELYDEIRESL